MFPFRLLVAVASGREPAFDHELNRGVTWNTVVGADDQPDAGHDGFCFGCAIELAEKIDLDFDTLSELITRLRAQQYARHTQIHDLSEVPPGLVRVPHAGRPVHIMPAGSLDSCAYHSTRFSKNGDTQASRGATC